MAPGASVGGKTKKFDIGDAFPFSGFGLTLLIWLAVSVSSLILGLVLLAFAPRAADAALVVARDATGAAIGWGALLVFGLPVLAVLALVTLVGIPLGVGLLLALTPIYSVGYVTGAWLLGRLILKRPTTGRYVAFLAGWGILRVVALIPILGGLGWLVATVFGLGTLSSPPGARAALIRPRLPPRLPPVPEPRRRCPRRLARRARRGRRRDPAVALARLRRAGHAANRSDPPGQTGHLAAGGETRGQTRVYPRLRLRVAGEACRARALAPAFVGRCSSQALAVPIRARR